MTRFSLRKVLKWVGALFGVLLVMVAFGLYGLIRHMGPMSQTFDSEQWKAHPNPLGARDPAETRLSMVDDLIRSKQLIGKSKAEVIALLGPPTKDPNYFSDWDMNYNLGMERGLFRIDSEWLLIEFSDGGDAVQFAQIMTD